MRNFRELGMEHIRRSSDVRTDPGLYEANLAMNEWTEQVDAFFALLFTLDASLVVLGTVRRFWAYNGPSYDWGYFMLLVFGFCIPGLLYLVYKLVGLLVNWWKKENLFVASQSLINPAWARRSATAFGGALFVNLGLYPLVILLWP